MNKDESAKKIKVAFFPYKISMWDSLESIWEAADRDESCECQVIPIPYYSKNTDGEIEKEHYEGAAFAKKVPIIDYQTYFLEQEMPDVMYVHNPYDQYNKVTMVHPRFFSTELKKGGGILVYVPYYISGFCEKYENMLPVCANMGAVYSDYLILQSENLKNAYAFCGYPERRLLVLGSPKVDAVYKIGEKQFSKIDEWKLVTENRKVILLNTSITTCLTNASWLEQIQKLIEPILQDNRLALIWRPHPLLLDTMRSMLQKQAEYDTLLERIRKAPNAIIDGSDTAEAAMKASDAMISDYSSLVMQYNFTGKPSYLLTGKSENRKDCVFCDYFSNYFREDGENLSDFLNMVLAGIDPKQQERMEYARSSMANTDGTCGEKVHCEICKKVMTGVNR